MQLSRTDTPRHEIISLRALNLGRSELEMLIACVERIIRSAGPDGVRHSALYSGLRRRCANGTDVRSENDDSNPTLRHAVAGAIYPMRRDCVTKLGKRMHKPGEQMLMTEQM